MAKSSKPAKPASAKAEAAAGAPQIDIGISGSDRKKIAEGLSRFLADSFTLYSAVVLFRSEDILAECNALITDINP